MITTPARRTVAALILALAALGYAAHGLSAADEKTPSGTFEIYKDKTGEYRWRLLAVNKQVIATSGDGYTEKRACLEGIESVRKAAANAKVEERPAE